ncbi:MAG: hypothetical protein PHR28_10670 [candidate division Zixibacteria bacterium]|nr:hypothetical protein [candidate division Zixibacteria bacterium]
MEGIGVSAVTYDLNGALYFPGRVLDAEEVQRNRQRERRMSKTPTLDGGCVIYDTGYSASDRDITIKAKSPGKAVVNFMSYLVGTYNEIVVTTNESAFTAAPQRYYVDEDGSAVLILSIIEDIGGS